MFAHKFAAAEAEKARRAAQSQRDKAAAGKAPNMGTSSKPRRNKQKKNMFLEPISKIESELMFQSREKRVLDKRVPSNLAPPGLRNNGRSSYQGENVTFDEYIAEVNGSVAFVATKYSVQPGIAGTFPKGSIKAALYSEWKMVNCEFYFKPEVSQYASQGQTGKVILAMDYNAGNPAPTTKQQVEIMHVRDAMPYEIIRLSLDASCVNKADSKYIRTGPAPVDEDIKTFDGGNLWVCTIGQAGAGLVGELHARYNFRCTKATLLNPAQGGLIPQTVASMYGQHAATSYVTATPKALVWDTTLIDGLGIGPAAAGVFTPPAGTYIVQANISWSDSVNEIAQALVEVQKNGVSLAAKCITYQLLSPAGGVGTDSSLSVQGIVSCNGADTVRIAVTLTGAAGALTTSADYCQLLFQGI
jgi:hypothetical protein